MIKTDLYVKGMTCASCEIIIERKIKKVTGVQNAQVSRAKEKLVVHHDDTVTLSQLRDAVRDSGYTLYEEYFIDHPPTISFTKKYGRKYAEIGAAFIIIVGVYLLVEYFGLIPDSIGVSDSMSYGVVFIIGLVAATSTCLAVAGGLLLTIATTYNEQHPHLTGKQRFIPHIYFNIGRIIGYTILGGLIGLLGSTITISPTITGIVTILASVLMIVIGLQLLHIIPWLNKIQVKMPKFIAHRIYNSSSKETKKVGSSSSFFFGASTFFLPCGFTQALQLYVLGKGDFITGALTMLIFSLGTLPSLAGIGAMSSFATGNIKKHFITFSAVLIIILGLFVIPSGFSLMGYTIYSDTVRSQGGMSQLSSTVPTTTIAEDKQVVNMKIIGLDYFPHQFTIKKGVPVEWKIDATQARGCAKVLMARKIGVQEFMPPSGTKTITFTPTQTGTIPFSCSMGMTTPGARFNVIEA